MKAKSIFFLFFIFISLAATAQWTGVSDTAFASGDGSSEQPYLISTPEQLAFLAEQVNAASYENSYYNLNMNISLGRYYLLTADMDLNGQTYTWTPIGNIADYNNNNKFQGYFDGGGHEITNMKVNVSGNVYLYAGLFGYTAEESTIKNLTIASSCHVIVNGTGVQQLNYAGAVVAYNNGLLESCINNAAVTGTTDDSNFIGGLAGYSHGTILNCNNYGNINADGITMSYKNAGGLAGYNEGILKGCYNNGAITVSNGIFSNAGGIAGGSSLSVENCYNDGSVQVQAGVNSWGNYIGGIIARGGGNVINSVNTATLTASGGNGSRSIGGFAGYFAGNIMNCYNTGNIVVAGTGTNWIGGLIGEGGVTLKNCYNSGNMSNSGTGNFTGGLIGENSDATIQNCYWLQTPAINTSLPAIGRGLVTGPKLQNNTSFDADGAFAFSVYQGLAITGTSSDYLQDALNTWVSVNVSSGSTSYQTWRSYYSFNNGFPIFGTPTQTPVITVQPTNQNTIVGQTASFSVSVETPADGGTLSYKWQVSTNNGTVWTTIDNATGAVYITNILTSENNGNKYRCVITNSRFDSFSRISSNPATLTVSAVSAIETAKANNQDLYVYPNPFTDKLTIPFTISNNTSTRVEIVFMDIAGRIVDRMKTESTMGGYYEFVWQPATSLNGGIYFCALKINDKLLQTQKLMYQPLK